MTDSPRLVIAVIGEGDCGSEPYATAEEVGVLAARDGAAVVCGGLGGVMEAACKGASSEGGVAIGILPGISRLEANPFVTIAIPTGLGEARNLLVVRTADAVIAVGGSYGTLSEIAFALKLGKPVVGLNTWELYKNGERVNAFPVCETPSDAVQLALAMAGEGR